MQFTLFALTALVASASAGKVIRTIFGRDELEAMMIQARDATEAQWVGKIQNWMKPEPLGISNTIKNILQQGGCQPPTGAKAKRSLDIDVSEQHLILTRRANTPVKKADAWAAAKNPAKLPDTIKQAFKSAGWTGTCIKGNQKRGIDYEAADDFELFARDFEEDFSEEY